MGANNGFRRPSLPSKSIVMVNGKVQEIMRQVRVSLSIGDFQLHVSCPGHWSTYTVHVVECSHFLHRFIVWLTCSRGNSL